MIKLEYTNGNPSREFATEDEAMEFVSEKDWTVCENGWETYGPWDSNKERLLLWETEEESINDGGEKAIAHLIRTK